MFLTDTALEIFILNKLDMLINWAVTRTVQVKEMVDLGSDVKVMYQDINNGQRYTMTVSKV